VLISLFVDVKIDLTPSGTKKKFVKKLMNRILEDKGEVDELERGSRAGSRRVSRGKGKEREGRQVRRQKTRRSPRHLVGEKRESRGEGEDRERIQRRLAFHFCLYLEQLKRKENREEEEEEEEEEEQEEVVEEEKGKDEGAKEGMPEEDEDKGRKATASIMRWRVKGRAEDGRKERENKQMEEARKEEELREKAERKAEKKRMEEERRKERAEERRREEGESYGFCELWREVGLLIKNGAPKDLLQNFQKVNFQAIHGMFYLSCHPLLLSSLPPSLLPSFQPSLLPSFQPSLLPSLTILFRNIVIPIG
jgi:hypothetical protein